MKGLGRGFSHGWVLIMAVALGLTAGLGAQAQVGPSVWPRCIAERDGQQLGQGGSICECHYDRGGTMTGRHPGWRWSCDILRMDGSELGIPADNGGGHQSLPPGFTYAPQNGGLPLTDNQALAQLGVHPRGPASLLPRRY